MLLIMEYFFYIISILCTASFYTVVIKLISIIAIYLWKYLQSWNKNDGNFNCPQMLSFLTHYIIIFIINNIIRAKNATIINSRDHRHNKTHSFILLTFFFLIRFHLQLLHRLWWNISIRNVAYTDNVRKKKGGKSSKLTLFNRANNLVNFAIVFAEFINSMLI